MCSVRSYMVTGFETGIQFSEKISLKRIVTDNVEEYEFIYALQEETDAILDLKVGESLFIATTRDNKNDKGVILRIS